MGFERCCCRRTSTRRDGTTAPRCRRLRIGATTRSCTSCSRTGQVSTRREDSSAPRWRRLQLGATTGSCTGRSRTGWAWNGHEAVVKRLLGKGVELESKENDGRTPAIVGGGGGRNDIARRSCYSRRAPSWSPETVEFMKTSLLWEAEKRHEAAVKLLLEKGAELVSKGSGNHENPAVVGGREEARGGSEAAAREGHRVGF